MRPIQYGFTEGVTTYLMGGLQRLESEQHCLDLKKTFFCCSLDGDSAFEVVNREILTTELYMSGERGITGKQVTVATKNLYQGSR